MLGILTFHPRYRRSKRRQPRSPHATPYRIAKVQHHVVGGVTRDITHPVVVEVGGERGRK
jgi:hypothetical protein